MTALRNNRSIRFYILKRPGSSKPDYNVPRRSFLSLNFNDYIVEYNKIRKESRGEYNSLIFNIKPKIICESAANFFSSTPYKTHPPPPTGRFAVLPATRTSRPVWQESFSPVFHFRKVAGCRWNRPSTLSA